MEGTIRDYYYNPETGFTSATKLQKRMVSDGLDVSLAEVEDVVNSQFVQQVLNPFILISINFPLLFHLK